MNDAAAKLFDNRRFDRRVAGVFGPLSLELFNEMAHNGREQGIPVDSFSYLPFSSGLPPVHSSLKKKNL